MRMDHNVDIGNILTKLDSIHGDIDKETILAEFYSAKQKEDNVLKWACRFDDILSRVIKQHQIHDRDANEMHKNML